MELQNYTMLNCCDCKRYLFTTPKVADQPFWKLETGDKRSSKLLPTDDGLLVPVHGKDRWTKVQLAWNTLGPVPLRDLTKEHKGEWRSFFIVTYPGNPEYTEDAKTLDFLIRDVVLLYPGGK